MERPQIKKVLQDDRPKHELFAEKTEQEASLKKLFKQLTVGCGKSSCANKECCATADKSKKEEPSKAI